MWATALQPDPSKKALFHTCRLVGADIKYRKSISVLSEQYETSYIFYVTLSFLCNIICYLISVFAFSLVTLFGAITYWRRGTRTKKGTLQQAKEDTSQQQRDTQLQVVKESTTKFQHTTNRTRILLNNYKVSNCTNAGVCRIADI